MKAIAALVVALSLTIVAGADVLMFDNLAPADWVGEAYIPDGYGGFNWDQFAFTHKDYYSPSGYHNGTVSGNFTAFNAYANVATVDNGQFDFNGAYLTGAWNDGLNIQVDGYRNGDVVYSKTVIASYYHPTWFDFNYLGVDKLTFSSYGGTPYSGPTQFAMDNFTYNQSVVPAPGAMILGMIGVGLVGWVKKRFA